MTTKLLTTGFDRTASVAADVLTRAAVWICASVLLFSGVVHAVQPYLFIHSVASYELLPSWIVGGVGLFVPYLQIVLALCLAFELLYRSALWMGVALSCLFIAAQSSALARGIAIDCGCFGFTASEVSAGTIMVPTTLLFCYLSRLWVLRDSQMQSSV